MKKTQRVASLIKILSDSPNQAFGLKTFCQLFDAAKSSISEDIAAAKEVVKDMELGRIETTPGAAGGVKFVHIYLTGTLCSYKMNYAKNWMILIEF